VIVEGRGVPLAIVQSAANAHDSTMLEAVVDAVPPIKRPSGQRRKRPGKLHTDKGYDYKRCRASLRRRGIKSRIARKGIERSDRLGRHRWVVERTLAWLNRFRRLTVRYERRADIHQAFLLLACSLICLRRIEGGLKGALRIVQDRQEIDWQFDGRQTEAAEYLRRSKARFQLLGSIPEVVTHLFGPKNDQIVCSSTSGNTCVARVS
jgi:transposase